MASHLSSVVKGIGNCGIVDWGNCDWFRHSYVLDFLFLSTDLVSVFCARWRGTTISVELRDCALPEVTKSSRLVPLSIFSLKNPSLFQWANMQASLPGGWWIACGFSGAWGKPFQWVWHSELADTIVDICFAIHIASAAHFRSPHV